MRREAAHQESQAMTKNVLKSHEEQLDRWVAGESLHSDHRGLGEECCPDFSCCKPQLQQPYEVRRAFHAATEQQRMKFLMAFLGGFLANAMPDVRAYITDGSHSPES
jgi:hypothetical protein